MLGKCAFGRKSFRRYGSGSLDFGNSHHNLPTSPDRKSKVKNSPSMGRDAPDEFRMEPRVNAASG
jgi:hypothetical protein